MPANNTATLSRTHNKAAKKPNFITVECNETLRNLLGSGDENIAPIKQRLDVHVSSQGNQIHLQGSPKNVNKAHKVLEEMLDQAAKGPVNIEDVYALIDNGQLPQPIKNDSSLVIRTPKKLIHPRTVNQTAFFKSVQEKDMTWASGPAGTGKTFLAIAAGVEELLEGNVDRLVLSRPAIGSENLGYKPGKTEEKVNEYMQPMKEALHELMEVKKIEQLEKERRIIIKPLDTLRGQNLKDSFVVLDEGQNTTPKQMTMFTNRMSEGSQYVIVGDPKQADGPIANMQENGLEYALRIYKKIPEMGFVQYTSADVVRHPLVQRMVEAQEKDSIAAKPSPAANAGAPSPKV